MEWMLVVAKYGFIIGGMCLIIGAVGALIQIKFFNKN